MAIQNRRGVYSDFTPTKMVPGEFAVVNSGDPNSTSGKGVYISFADGQAKRLVMEEDVQNEVAKATEDIAEQIEDAVADDLEAAQAAATTASTKASEAAASATQAAQTVANIIDNTLTQTGKAADAKVTGDELQGVKEDLNEKAPAITGQTESKNSFTKNELSNYDNYFAVCDASNMNFIGVAKGSGILPESDPVTTDKWIKESGNSITVNTTISGEAYYFTRYNNAYNATPLEEIFAGDIINFAIILNGEITGQIGTSKQWVKLTLTYIDDSSSSLNLELPVNGGHVANTIIAEKNVKKIAVQIRFMWGTYNNVEISWSATKGENASYTFHNGGDIKRLSTSDIGTDGFTIFPSKAYVVYVFDTKKYVDEHIPDDMLVASDLVYLTPEMYGAVGDGVHDDTSAINALIEDVLSVPNQPKAAIRGFGRYKITSGITLYGAYIDSYFNQIIYNGNDAAITLIGAYSKFCFGVVNAYGGGSNSVGIRCTTKDTPAYAYDGFYDNYVECKAVLSKGNTVELIYPTTAQSEGIYYNVFKFQQQYSSNGNCIYVVGRTISEIDIYGKIASAQNGYLFYRDVGENIINGTHPPIRLHQYGIEHTVKNGIKGNVALIQCRTRELMDRPNSGGSQETVGGYLFDFSGLVPNSLKDDFGDIDLTACKIDTALTFSDLLQIAKEAAENGTGIYKLATTLGEEARSYAYFKNAIRVSYSTSKNLIPGDMYVYYRHIAFKPREDWYHIITADFDIASAFPTASYITPTTFDIDTANATIRLDYSYCCIAINEFRVIQHTGKTAIIYDKLGNKIFDGTNLGEGTFVFKCSRVPLDAITFELQNGSSVTIPAEYVRRIYTGENEKWTITKQEFIG